jgi:ribosomal protein S18 acetylase RimI-like enzyme
MPPLPILHVTHAPTPDALLRYLLHTEYRWTEHLAEAELIDVGAAFANTELSGVRDANRIFNAKLPDSATADEALREVETHYEQRNLRCQAWLMDPSAPSSRTEPLVELLLSRGHRRLVEDVLYLQQLPRQPIEEVASLKVIPARASYRHARQLAEEATDNHPPELAQQMIEASMAHLDDPHYDALLALKDGAAVAKVGVLAAGEVGRIEPLYVGELHRRQGLGRTMMSRALEICARSLFKHIFLTCMPENAPAQALYASLGFRKIGEMVAYIAPENANPRDPAHARP